MKNKFFTLWLSAIIILIFILQNIIPGFTDSLVLNQQSFPEIWRFITAIFLHGSLIHIVSNLFALILFGLILEKLISSNKFLIVFFSSGIIANIISVNFYPSSLGASGAIMGIIGTLTIIRPLMTVFAFSIPMPMFIAAIIWAAGDVLGIFYPQVVGNIAHLSGLAIGLILGIYFRTRHKEKQTLRADYARINIPESYMRDWEDTWMR
jgi:hypothetical protein